MLIEFATRNFMSFKNETVLSAETGERLSRLKKTNTLVENGYALLKNLLIFGPNGAGKTNLLSGLRWMKQMVLQDRPTVTMKFPAYRPYVLNKDTQTSPVMFRVMFNTHGHTYAYEFSFNQTEIVAEKLSIVTAGKATTYFERQRQAYPVLPQHLDALQATTKKNTLLLFTAQQMNDAPAIDVFQWFQNDLLFVERAEVSDELVTLIEDERVKAAFLQFLHFADFNIVDIRVRHLERPQFPPQIRQMLATTGATVDELPRTLPALFTVHKEYNAAGDVVGEEELPLSSESKGTQKIFVIGLSVINAQLNGDGKTLLFDEFDDSLHVELSKALIKIFNSAPNQNQFILTTHELQLLNEEVRVDQIYLVDKDFQGVSDLKSIFDFDDARHNTRRDVSFMKRYMQGRFGALPVIDADEMLSALDGVTFQEER